MESQHLQHGHVQIGLIHLVFLAAWEAKDALKEARLSAGVQHNMSECPLIPNCAYGELSWERACHVALKGS